MNRAQASAGPVLMKREKWDCLRVGGTLEQFCDLVNMSRRGSKEEEEEGGRDGGRKGRKKMPGWKNNLLCSAACLHKCASTVGGPECPDAEQNFTN